MTKRLLAALALAGSAAGTTAQAQTPAPAPSSTQIDTAVSVSYLPAVDGPTLTTSSNTASVMVDQTAGVVLSPPLSTKQIGKPIPTSFAVTLRNTGTGTDTFTLSLTRPAQWSANLIAPAGGGPAAASSVTLDAGQSRTFIVSVTPPAIPHPGSAMIVLKATSGFTASVFAQAAIVTNCTGH